MNRLANQLVAIAKDLEAAEYILPNNVNLHDVIRKSIGELETALNKSTKNLDEFNKTVILKNEVNDSRITGWVKAVEVCLDKVGKLLSQLKGRVSMGGNPYIVSSADFIKVQKSVDSLTYEEGARGFMDKLAKNDENEQSITALFMSLNDISTALDYIQMSEEAATDEGVKKLKGQPKTSSVNTMAYIIDNSESVKWTIHNIDIWGPDDFGSFKTSKFDTKREVGKACVDYLIENYPDMRGQIRTKWFGNDIFHVLDKEGNSLFEVKKEVVEF